MRGRDGSLRLDGLDLSVGPDEILGVAGVEGNGQRELGDVLSSLLQLDAGRIEVEGVEVPTGRARAMAAAGVGTIPEDRHDSGCVLDMSIAENLFLASPAAVARRGMVNHATMAPAGRGADGRVRDTSPPGRTRRCACCPVATSSGWCWPGELSAAPKVLVAAQPSHGLDVGAIEYMSGRLRAAADAGVGVLLISSELEEILALAHRIVVVHRGRVVGEMSRAEADLEHIGLLMGGVPA